MIMVRIVAPLVGCAALAVSGWSQAAEVDVKAGRWEVTSTASIEDEGDLPPQTKTMCLSSTDLVPQSKGNKACVVSDVAQDGNAVSWNVRCEDPDSGMKAEGSGTVTYSGETLEGTTSMTVTPLGQPAMKMKARLEGRRVGDCEP